MFYEGLAEQMDRWLGGWKGEWIDGQMEEEVGKRMGVLADGWIDVLNDEHVD